MKVLIIEDEPATAQRLKRMLKEHNAEIKFMEIIDTVEESVNYLKTNLHPDLIFMDIHLADGISFEIFDQVTISCPIIFTTAYDQYAIKAFKVNSIDYLLKPINKEELANSIKKYYNTVPLAQANDFNIQKVIEMFNEKSKPDLKRIVVKIGPKINAITISDVSYFQVMNKSAYAILHKGNSYPVDFTMEQLETELNSKEFCRINRSFIISFDSITSMIAYSKSRIKITLTPKCNEDVISSTDRTGPFKEWLKGK